MRKRRVVCGEAMNCFGSHNARSWYVVVARRHVKLNDHLIHLLNRFRTSRFLTHSVPFPLHELSTPVG